MHFNICSHKAIIGNNVFFLEREFVLDVGIELHCNFFFCKVTYSCIKKCVQAVCLLSILINNIWDDESQLHTTKAFKASEWMHVVGDWTVDWSLFCKNVQGEKN